MVTWSLPILVMAWSECILLECFLVKVCFPNCFNINLQTYQVSFEPKVTHFQIYSSWFFFWKLIFNCILGPPNLGVRGEWSQVFPGFISFYHDIYYIFQNSMIFPGFPGVLSFFQVFQVDWEPWNKDGLATNTQNLINTCTFGALTAEWN